MKDFTLKSQIDDVRRAARLRQAADESVELENEVIDTVSNCRGAGADFSMTLREVAELSGFSDAPNPAKKGQLLVSTAISNFALNGFIMVIVDACERIGISRDDALSIAENAYERELNNGKTRIDIFREVFCG